MDTTEVLAKASTDPTFAVSLLDGLASVRIAAAWHVSSDGTTMSRDIRNGRVDPYLRVAASLCYRVDWDAGAPCGGYLDVTVLQSRTERVAVSEVVFWEAFQAGTVTERLREEVAVVKEKVDAELRAKGWLLL